MTKQPRGEMPFLDHLEELRWRIIRSLIALAIGAIIGFLLVQNFDVLELLKRPIAPYLPDGKLYVTRPTDAFLITLKLAVLVGAILAAPVIFSQVWAFLSPALYDQERRFIVPALLAGLVLFSIGVAIAYVWVMPAALKFLLTRFQQDFLESIITADAYFRLAIQLILAFGIMFEVPLFMVLLSAMGLVSPAAYTKHRPFAIVIGAILSAMLTPPDVVSMLMLMLPVVLLYEAGILVSRVIWRKRARETIGAGAVIFLIAGWTAPAHAQDPPPRPPPARTADSVAQPIDTATARRMGLPTAPSRQFPAADSVMRALLEREGYQSTRYAGDSMALVAADKRIVLIGQALVEREGSTLEADSVNFVQNECQLIAGGGPTLFDGGSVLVGRGMRYDTCERRGVVARAETMFNQSGVDWFLHGELAIDSASTRTYGAAADFTSCELPTEHYHFRVRSVKWVKNTILVGRPAVLYVRDVPIMWLPFIFQDMRQGRRSGMLVPRFGFNDLVRPNTGYRRHVSNIGYYFALNDYMDLQASLDWFAGNYVAVNGQLRYRWLNRFVSGNLGVSRIFESGFNGQPGARSLRLQWTHQQSFDQQTRLTANVDFATSARVVERNAVDPLVQTATLGSRINFNKQFDWGTLTVGASRTQDLSNGSVSQTLPSISLAPAPVNIGTAVTWSPSFSISRDERLDQQPGIPLLTGVGGGVLVDTLLPDTRTTSIRAATPFRIGRWNWRNDVTITDFRTTRPPAVVTVVDPVDSTVVATRYYAEDFDTKIDWNTGINLPVLFPGTWKLQPTLGIQNTTSRGPFMLRNRFTGGQFVRQGKRLSFGASLSPSVFGFFPGIGPLSRIRHAVSPQISWNFQPSANVSEEYARALAGPGATPEFRSPTLHSITFGLSQTFEGKLRPAPGDTAQDPRQAPKLKLLSIQSSSMSYDFEQAKLPGRTGWLTQTLRNSFTSDLLRGLSLSTVHDLWDGPVGFDSTSFDPFLTSVSMRFSLSGATIGNVVALLTGGQTQPDADRAPGTQDEAGEADLLQPVGTATSPPRGLDPAIDRLGSRPLRGRGLTIGVTYDDRRPRPPRDGDGPQIAQSANRTLGLQFGFSPTTNWSASWNTQYNLTTKEFGQHVVRFDRDLHRWRATFAFVKAPNGNFAFNFFVSLTDQPEIKFQYDQRSVRQGR